METAATPVASARGAAGGRPPVSDGRLIARIRSGDEEAFGAIYDRYAGSLLAFCRHMLGTREEAEDALQHVFVAAHKQLRSGPQPEQLKPWLYAVARNRCLSVLRSRRETVALDDLLEPAGRADTSGEAEQREDVREILGDVAALPHDQREALILAEVGALSHDEIAVTLGVRKDKVKALVFQARQSLMVSREARETSCHDIQQQLAVLRGGALRRGAIRRHVDGCPACAAFKSEVQRQRSLLAAALPVLPAAALKPTILAAAHAGAGGAGIAAAGGASVVAATAASSTAGGGGALGLGSSALVTKFLAVAAVAGVAGGGAAVVRSEHHAHRAPAAAHVARPAAASTATTTAKATTISALAVPAAGRPGSAQKPEPGRPRQGSPETSARRASSRACAAPSRSGPCAAPGSGPRARRRSRTATGEDAQARESSAWKGEVRPVARPGAQAEAEAEAEPEAITPGREGRPTRREGPAGREGRPARRGAPPPRQADREGRPARRGARPPRQGPVGPASIQSTSTRSGLPVSTIQVASSDALVLP